jgi:N-methylhydantoinase A/oxoprolinase/acetone carboxylase beta subunit
VKMHRLGIDVGGTHTDAVILDEQHRLIAKTKARTSPDVSTGILEALDQVLAQPGVSVDDIGFAMLGTTHCTNAITERKNLSTVAVIRLGAPATLAIPPLYSWPEDLKQKIASHTFIIDGGHEFDGRIINTVKDEEVDRVIDEIRGKVEAISIASVFSPVNAEHEIYVGERLRRALGDDIPITLSYEIGSVGLLERENAAVLNASLMRTATMAFTGFRKAIQKKGLHARLFLGQNDGTLMSVDYALRYPILTIASGPSNSLRGGAFLSGLKDAIVIDVGGTTTDVGVLAHGFPRESALAVDIGGVRTSFRMPDLISIGLGGGSLVRTDGESVTIGPDSVGYRLIEEGIVFGGATLTATDIAVALGRVDLGDASKLPAGILEIAAKADIQMKQMVEHCIDGLKLSADPVPVVLVGGGSVLLPDQLEGASVLHRPDNFDVANAIGVAIAPVSAQVDRVFSYGEFKREDALALARQTAIEKATEAGAHPEEIEIVELEEVAMAYMPGDAVRIKIKAAGPLTVSDRSLQETNS